MRFRTFWLVTIAGLLGLGNGAAAERSPKDKAAAHEQPESGGSALDTDAVAPKPKFGPPPAWVIDPKIPAPNPKHADDPFQFLLSSSQEYLTPSGLENFVEYAVQPLNQAGLTAIGNVQVPWNVNRTDLTLNAVKIARGGKIIDVLNRDDLSVIRRETKLEEATLTGLRTVVLPVRGLEIGDELIVSFTYKTKPGLMGKIEEVQDIVMPVAVGRLARRLVVSDELGARWDVNSGVKNAEAKHTALGTERDYVTEGYEPPKSRNFVPVRFKHSLIQVSAFKSWSEVADTVAPLFEVARKTSPNSDVAALADKIAAEHKDPHERMLGALRTAQDQVRYVALLLGDGNYKPMSADEVWSKRFGDCKGKTAFLLALLDRLGIQAEPVLASVQYDDGIAQQLPSLAMLDHIYVRAHIGAETYFLDGTNFGQRTLEELRTPTTVHVLPLIANADLVTVPDVQASAPTIETDLVWDARNGILKDVPFEATLVLRGSAAAHMRLQTAISTDHDKLITDLKNKVNGVANDALEYVSSEPDRADGTYVVHFKGKTDLDWSPVQGMKGNRFQFNQSTITWKADFDRDDDAGKTIPVAMTFPYWERTVEKVLLPNGGKDFTIDAPAVDETVAVTHISRSVTLANGVATSISDFKRLSRELDPASARAAKDPLKKITDDYAYIVSRKKLKLDK
jgi:hypothetical protein